MAREIERKFLVRASLWESLAKLTPEDIQQGYLFSDDLKSLRIRLKGTQAFLTIKQRVSGMLRHEFEYAIPPDEARFMLQHMARSVIIKKRFVVPYDGLFWEVDVFEGDNAGLVLAEIELSAEDQTFSLPPWVGEEVSEDERYYNIYLAEHPYTKWPK
jgi:adenylate cyclase